MERSLTEDVLLNCIITAIMIIDRTQYLIISSNLIVYREKKEKIESNLPGFARYFWINKRETTIHIVTVK